MEVFNKDHFKFELSRSLDQNKITNASDYASFERNFEHVLDRYAPMKTKFLRGNNQPHVSSKLRKAIMIRSKLIYKVNKTKLGIRNRGIMLSV